MSDVNFVDGQALDPTSFGAFNANGVWTPIPPTVSSYGTNGFRLKFENASNLGEDASPNGNNFTVNNLTSVDQSGDYPVNNFATGNPLAVNNGASHGFSLSNGNLTVTASGGNTGYDSTGTLAVSQGKWYFEGKLLTSVVSESSPSIGIIDIDKMRLNNYAYLNGVNYLYAVNGDKISDINGSTTNSAYGDTYNQNDIIGVALDLDNGFIYWSKNGVFQNSGDPTSGATGTGNAFSSVQGNFTILIRDYSNANVGTWDLNFGHPPYAVASGNADGNGYGNFEYTVPSGYYSLCTKNLAEYG